MAFEVSNHGVRASHYWDVKIPPPKKHIVGGHLVPTVRGFAGGRLMQKTRRVTIEIHGPMSEVDSPSKGTDSQLMKGLLEGAHPNHHELLGWAQHESLQEEDRVIIRVLKAKSAWGIGGSTDDGDSSDEESLISKLEMDGAGEEPDGDWSEHHRFDLDELEITKTHKNTVEFKLGKGSRVEIRQINFADEREASAFAQEIEELKGLEKERAQQKLDLFRSTPRTAAAGGNVSRDLDLGGLEEVNLLVEIVSAQDLPVADLGSSDPYVIVFLGKEEVHRTKHLSKTIDPIWTVANGSLFILSAPIDKFFQSSAGLTFVLKDYDAVGSNEILGTVHVPHKDLLEADGERKEYKLLQDREAGKKKKKSLFIKPKLNLRFRNATPKDVKFMTLLARNKKSKKLGVVADDCFVAPQAHKVKMLKRETKRGDHGTPLHRVKPFPDPKREKETKWLTEQQLDAESNKPSQCWIEAGSGDLGKLFFEVLRCDDLPNLDATNIGFGAKSDPFCSILFEDAIVNTDVINDTMSPRFMPWSQRAFVFHIAHPSSQVLVGVFDYDNEMSAHDSMGRVSVDITNFSADTEYVLQYDLFRSTLDDDRKVIGKITVRLRIEWSNFRKAMIASVLPPPKNHVNVAKKDDYRTAHFVCYGEEDIHNFDMDLIKSYGNELEALQDLIPIIEQAVLTVLLWRGHFPVSFRVPWCQRGPGQADGFMDRFTKVVTVKLPLHSITNFVLGVLLVDDFNFLPSFSLFCIAWFLLATMEERRRNPSPWNQCHSFLGLWAAFLLNKPFHEEIAENENEAEIREYVATHEEKRRKQKEKAAADQEHAADVEALLGNEEAEANGTDDIATSAHQNKMSVNPLKPILFPLQLILGQVCVAVRIARSIIIWDESHYAFLITNACIVAGLSIVWVPWAYLVRWILRVVVWVCFGPWMKLVDIFYVKKLDAKKMEQQRKVDQVTSKSLGVVLAKRTKMIRKEDATKLKAFKKYLFGNYIVRVPRFREYRFRDLPLQASNAIPFGDGTKSKYNVSSRRHGQHLVGNMIPTWGDGLEEDESAPLKGNDATSYGSIV